MTHLKYPLGKLFTTLTKQYIALLSDKLSHLPIERYYYILYVIGEYSGKIGQHQLADFLALDKVTVFRMVEYLEKNGMVERIPNPEDRRCQLLLITKNGETWMPHIKKAIDELDEFFLSALPKDQQKVFTEQLQLVICKTTEIPTERIDFQFNKITDLHEEH